MMLRVACCAFAVAACGDDEPGTEITETSEAEVEVEVETSEVEAEATNEVEVEVEVEVADVEVIDNAWGFPIRTPASFTFTCDGGGPFEELTATQADWICTLEYDGMSAHIYTQSTPTECEVSLGAQPIFGENAGWLTTGDGLVALGAVSYDWGGNHHNDSLSFTYEGKTYRYYHSSFGFGFRKCQEMDCLQVRGADNALIEDGCTSARTLPAVCRQVTAEGTWGDFTDRFEKCNGDPNVP